MDKIDSYWDWDDTILRVMEKPDGSWYVEGFDPKTGKWADVPDFTFGQLFFCGQLTPEEAEARIAELTSSKG